MRQLRLVLFILCMLPVISWGLGSGHDNQNGMLFALSLIFGGTALSQIVCKIGLPAVIGELSLGMIFATFAHFHWGEWQQIVQNEVITFFAEVGSILLLFEIGLESDISDLLKVGKHGLITAVIGVLLPFALGYWFLGHGLLSSNDAQLNLFMGATLAATSTGISVRVFKDLGIIRNPACQIVLTASVIDDILGLIILAFVSGMVITGGVNFSSISTTLFNVILFFVLVFFAAGKIMPFIIKLVLRISNKEPMILAVLMAFCFFLSWLAGLIGLAPIIGAFVAGLIIDETAFRNSQHPYWYSRLVEFKGGHMEYWQMSDEIIAHYHKEKLSALIKPLNYVFVPVFFVFAGMQVDIMAVTNSKIILYGVAISLIAIAGKVASGVFLPKSVNRWLVGFGMVPRGEIGLIFAMTGKQLGIFSQEIFAAILIMVIITSLVTPIALQKIVKHGL